jgi:hypothetical protein
LSFAALASAADAAAAAGAGLDVDDVAGVPELGADFWQAVSANDATSNSPNANGFI